MPIVTVQMTSGRTQEQKLALIRRITDVVVQEAECPVAAVSVLIDDRYSLDSWAVGGQTWAEKLESFEVRV